MFHAKVLVVEWENECMRVIELSPFQTSSGRDPYWRNRTRTDAVHPSLPLPLALACHQVAPLIGPYSAYQAEPEGQ